MNTSPSLRGPWHHRLLTWIFSGLLGLLTYWLLGFVVHDIGSWPGPDYQQVMAQHVDPSLEAQAGVLSMQLAATNRAVADERTRQGVLRDSTDNSARTMNQMLEIQRIQVQRGMSLTELEQEALREAQRLFLTTQQQYQESNQRVSALTERLQNLEAEQRDLEQRLQAQQEPGRRAYSELQARHQWRLALGKLAILIPLLAVAVFLFLRYRGSAYAPAVYAIGMAVAAKVLLVMHEHFPRRYFKYLLIAAALAVVGRVLLHLLRQTAAPRQDWILKQYREAYEHHLCPRCSYPIRRGPLRFAFWTRRSLKRLVIPAQAGPAEDTPYVCPSCRTSLFETCPECGAVRHALLPACSRCGAEKAMTALGG